MTRFAEFVPDRSSPGTARRVNWFRRASPQTAYPLAGTLHPWLAGLSVPLGVAGIYLGLFAAPTDVQHGEAHQIIFLHVPAAWVSIFLYFVMAFWAGIGLALNSRLFGMVARAVAPTGALFTVLALWTGALWGKPTWGAWWVWDARLASELILLFLYFGFMALQGAIDDPRRADRAGALLALVGMINIPIIYFSVRWWSVLHQDATVSLMQGPGLAITTLVGMVLMTLAFCLYGTAMVLARLRCIILERERDAVWVADPARGLR